MALPRSKQELADWILRRLGAPVVNIEITDSQLEDVIDEAVQFFQEWHYDGAERAYRVIKIEGDVLTGNKRIVQQVNAEVFSATKDYRVGDRVMKDDLVYVKFDSETRVSRHVYTSNTSGDWWTESGDSIGMSDSDNGFVMYDSDLHTKFVYTKDDNGTWILDSDNNYIPYDSDIYTAANLIYSQSLTGPWVLDSNGNYITYDPNIHFEYMYMSDENGDWVLNDDGMTFRAYDPNNTFLNEVRFIRKPSPPVRYSRHSVPKILFKRETVSYGERFTRDSDMLYKNPAIFENFWKQEEAVLVEPTVNYDYSKTGQVGIPIPDSIIGINKVFRIDNFSGMGMWNYEYQYFLNNFDFFYGNGGASQQPMTNYYITKSYLDLIDNMMNVQPAIRFSKHRNRLYIDTNWSRLKNMAKSRNYYLMMECYEVNDPEVYGDVYKDKWLKRYATALAKQQWGSNMKKYTNTELPGGLMIDGQALYDEAVEEKDALEEELKSSQLEMDFFVG